MSPFVALLSIISLHAVPVIPLAPFDCRFRQRSRPTFTLVTIRPIVTLSMRGRNIIQETRFCLISHTSPDFDRGRGTVENMLRLLGSESNQILPNHVDLRVMEKVK